MNFSLATGVPAIGTILLAAAGIACIVARRRTPGMVLLGCAAAWLWLCAAPWFALALWRGLADQYPPRPIESYPGAAAIVLVGGGPVPAPLPQWVAADRPALATPLGVAVALYQAGKAGTIVAIANYAMPEFLRALARQGIPPTALKTGLHSATTRSDALVTVAALRGSRGARVLLVATRSHMPRAAATFRRAGFVVVPVPTRAPPPALPDARSPWPTRTALRVSGNCLHEYLGLAYYRIRGWAAW